MCVCVSVCVLRLGEIFLVRGRFVFIRGDESSGGQRRIECDQCVLLTSVVGFMCPSAMAHATSGQRTSPKKLNRLHG